MKTQTIMKEMTLLLPAVLNRNQKVISLDFQLNREPPTTKVTEKPKEDSSLLQVMTLKKVDVV